MSQSFRGVLKGDRTSPGANRPATVPGVLGPKKRRRVVRAKVQAQQQTAPTESTVNVQLSAHGSVPRKRVRPCEPSVEQTLGDFTVGDDPEARGARGRPGSAKRRPVAQRSPNRPTPKMAPSTPSADVTVSARRGPGQVSHEKIRKAVDDFVRYIQDLGVEGLKKEFKVTRKIPRGLSCDAFFENGDRNRYGDVLCIDKTRTVLTLNVPPETNYVHANWVRVPNCDVVFIATQGPLVGTCGDFWRLCYQESVTTILMLCNIREKGREKCAQYFPDKEKMTKKYGSMIVTANRITREKGLETYMLNVSFSGYLNSIVIKLIHMLDWPDKGVPRDGAAVLQILRRIDRKGPCVVHCSAGVGRTGSAIAIEVVKSRLFKGLYVNLKSVLEEIRSMRAISVQNDSQYLFVVSTLFEYIKVKIPRRYDRVLDKYISEIRSRPAR